MALDFLFERPAQQRQVQLFTPQQQQLQNQSIQQALSLLQGSPDAYKGFQPIAQQARSQFQKSTVPSLAERFTSLGSGGSQRSSAFQGALGSAASDLEQGLAALQSQYGQNQLRNLLATGIQPSFGTTYTPREPGIAEQGLGALVKYLPRLLLAYASGGGSEIPEALKNLFSKLSESNMDQQQSLNPQQIFPQFGQNLGTTTSGAFNPLMAGLQKGFYGL